MVAVEVKDKKKTAKVRYMTQALGYSTFVHRFTVGKNSIIMMLKMLLATPRQCMSVKNTKHDSTFNEL